MVKPDGRRQNLAMLFVALETSSLVGGVALFENGECLQETRFTAGPDQGRELLPAVRETLLRAGRTVADLGGVAVGRGPGSYTGMRLGVTAAKTLSFALRRPVVAESSLRVMSVNLVYESLCGVSSGAEGGRQGAPAPSPPSSSYVATLLDGRQTFLYGALFRVRSSTPVGEPPERSVEVVVGDRVSHAEGLAGDFAAAIGDDEAPIVLIGDGADLFLERLAERGGAAVGYARGPAEWDNPRATALGHLCRQRLAAASFCAEDSHQLAPAYLRPTEAERKLAGI